MPDGQPVQRLRRRAAALHPRLRSGVRTERAQGDVDGTGRSCIAGARARRGDRRAGTGRRVRALALRQCAGHWLRRASEIAALRRLPGGAWAPPAHAGGVRGRARRRQDSAGCSGMSAPVYNFAYLDEQTKRMIRRAILKAIAIPGYQVPFASREMPMPYGWGTGGVQVTAAILGPDDVLKVIDQGSDDTTNAVSVRKFFAKTAGIR